MQRANRATESGSYLHVFAVLLLAAFCVSACQPKEAAAPAPAAGPPALSWTHFDPPTQPPVTPELIAQGQRIYSENCASCHGPKGEGNGMCSAFLSPRPRNFVAGVMRFKTTPGAELPTDADLFRTVSLGLRGTPMPPWKFLLSENDRWAAIAYVKTLAPALAQKPGTPVDLGAEPSAISPQHVASGKQLYLDAGCPTCHGDEGYGDGQSADTLLDYAQLPIRPRNFHKGFEFKRGHTLRDIALTIATGNNGTPMPSFRETLEPGQIWDVAEFVYGLDNPRLAPGSGSQSAATHGEELGRPDVVIKLRERAWVYSPGTITVRQGQIVRVDFQPTDNGLGVGHGFAVDGYDKDVFLNGVLVGRPKSVTFVANKAGTFTFYCATQCSTGSLHPNMKGTLIVLAADGNGK
ncbi:MAG TPA: c-type cytochrome [Candidatus Acidoferrales bacterium]|nr:c-type cytochrome [Candidatus Acidoferrales bacterium]